MLVSSDTWHSISEQIYGIRDYWWVLALFNEVEDPFQIFYNSSINTTNYKIKYIKPAYVTDIVDAVRQDRIRRENSKFLR